MHESHSIGAAAEYAAASWFLSQGYQVYWPSMQQTAVDFIVEREGKTQRVQVKAATWRPMKGAECLRFRPHGSDKRYPPNAFELIAVTADSRMWLFPFAAVCHRDEITLETHGRTRRNKPQLDPESYRVK